LFRSVGLHVRREERRTPVCLMEATGRQDATLQINTLYTRCDTTLNR